jgi:hypothetical protein
MTVKRVGALVVMVVLAVAGCSKGPTTAAAPPPATTVPGPTGSVNPSTSATPTASPAALVEFTVDGAGPYQLGSMLATLQAAGSLDEVTPSAAPCPDNTTAKGKGVWHDVGLFFHKDGKLYLLVNHSAEVPTPSGAWLGTPLAQLKTIYAGVTGQDLTQGANKAFLVTTLSGRGILFELDPTQKVSAMRAGDASFLRANYQSGANFC